LPHRAGWACPREWGCSNDRMVTTMPCAMQQRRGCDIGCMAGGAGWCEGYSAAAVAAGCRAAARGVPKDVGVKTIEAPGPQTL